MGKRTCIVCKNFSSKSSYFVLPANKNIANIWLDCLQLRNVQFITTDRFCSSHFHESSYTVNATTGHARLKKFAIPFEPYDQERMYKIANGQQNVQDENAGTSASQRQVGSFSKASKNADENKTNTLNFLGNHPNVDVFKEIKEEPSSPKTPMMKESIYLGDKPQVNAEASRVHGDDEAESLQLVDDHSDVEVTNNFEEQPSPPRTPRTKRKSYPGDVDVSVDFQALKERKIFEIMKKTITAQKKKIATLRQASRRKTQRITTLVGLIKELKKKRVLTF